jgi:glycosyltransferase involved in cell wall biosynthesis
VKIIVITPAVPHPFGDTAARWFYVLITELLARDHEVVVLSATQESDAHIAEAEQWLKPHAKKLDAHFHRLSVDRVTLRRKWRSFLQPGSELVQDKDFATLVRAKLAQGYDVLHLEQMSTGWLGVGAPRALLSVHFFDVIDFSARKSPSLGDRKALWQAKRATRELLTQIKNARLLTPRLKEMAESINPNGRYWVVPLALDTSLYPLQPLAAEPVVGLIGSMHWEPSRSAAERLIVHIWPLVKKRIQNAKLYIAGWNAEKYLNKYLPMQDVTLSENLAHPRDFFSLAAVLVYAPSRGSGMKVKVMESMAYGVPVVTTWEGVEGFEYQNGLHCWVAETNEEIAEKVCGLLENPAEREQMRVAARTLIEDRYSPRPVVDQLMSVYGQLTATANDPALTSSCT